MFYIGTMRQRVSQRSTNVAYYWQNRRYEIRRVKARQALTIALLRDLRKRPCADCGEVLLPHQKVRSASVTLCAQIAIDCVPAPRTWNA